MAKYSNTSYFESRPDIVKIFDDLEKFRDFCRFEMCDFNEANLYNRNSQIWNNYYYSTRPRKPRPDGAKSGYTRKNYQR